MLAFQSPIVISDGGQTERWTVGRVVKCATKKAARFSMTPDRKTESLASSKSDSASEYHIRLEMTLLHNGIDARSCTRKLTGGDRVIANQLVET
jgi:hypothetical protein